MKLERSQEGRAERFSSSRGLAHEVAAFFKQFEPLRVDMEFAAASAPLYASCDFDVLGLIEDWATVD